MKITAIVRMNQEDPTIISYLRVKAFVLLNTSISHQIDQIDTGDKKKLTHTPSSKVNATSIKHLELKYDNLPVTGIDVMASSITTDVFRNENGQSILDFCLDKYLREKEPNSF
ncbi:9484_t:CDS:2 [Funneliformis caledonium]|uniref:9484_t:CDS:1 n=1 Tax=Funneliformis caledonium TaxID=1117310 RepID=A0A9N9IM25_9GLOM|nr:9484_t:CDS:2 [Funneliformis caledonium]